MSRWLHLVRHASVDGQHEGRYTGRTDVPLSQAGVAEAVALRPLLGRLEWDTCFCSPLQRVVQTAELALAPSRPAVHLLDDLREVDFGEWERQTFGEICASCDPYLLQRWADLSPDFAFPCGERLGDFVERVCRVADQFAADPGEALLVFTHGGVIRAMICHLLALPMAAHITFSVPAASLTTLELFGARGVMRRMGVEPGLWRDGGALIP